MLVTIRWLIFSAGLLLCGAAHATYSIVLIDTETGEIGVSAATCETGYDLAALVPVIRVGRGAACAQSGGDWSGLRRLVIWDELARGTHPKEILQILAIVDPGHETHQYGIVDVQGRATAFTGALCGYGNHRSGVVGTIHYAISGNGLPGDIVVEAAEAALLAEPGGVAEKLIAGMETAAKMGGDGRCSCNPFRVTACGAPPNKPFEKSAHIAFLIISRPGDKERACPPTESCEPPQYYFEANITDGTTRSPDPIFEMHGWFNEFREAMIGVPDGIQSLVALDTATLLAGSGQKAILTVDVRDWRGVPVVDFNDVLVTHDPEAGEPVTQIGSIVEWNEGIVRIELLAGETAGTDRFLIEVVASDGRRVRVARSPVLSITNGDDPKGGGQQSGGEPGSEPGSGGEPGAGGEPGGEQPGSSGEGGGLIGGAGATLPLGSLLCPMAALLLSALALAGRRTLPWR